ncbi:flagellar basal body-associated FliL family protein [Dechloromonas sp.]|uniref:flagellar basal body-associated FliL family protein n=1 Tax=Dechloromonas sp. TaxID=1917218 RepID=UPI00216E4D07|nr:flagellar basal body-associated FliL family protein [Dechloromonas sp.]MBU3697878.1 flagellar basal body-associated FliL family protein [Dechloromonas sp.]
MALIKSFLVVVLIALSLSAQSSDGGGATGLGEMVLTVSVGNNQYLNVGVVLEAATPEESAMLGAWKPRLQHEAIMLLAGRDTAELRSLAGKKALL